MHIITDENGNPVPHGHGRDEYRSGAETGHEHHGHEGDHEQQHNQEHEHEHQHEHEHHHDHDHHHDHAHAEGAGHGARSGPSGFETREQMAALVEYMLKHNQHHALELEQLAAKLESKDCAEASEQIRKAVVEFQKGNMYLTAALSAVKEKI